MPPANFEPQTTSHMVPASKYGPPAVVVVRDKGGEAGEGTGEHPPGAEHRPYADRGARRELRDRGRRGDPDRAASADA